MNTNPKSVWGRIALSLTLAFLFGVPIYVALTALSTAAADLPNWRDGDVLPTLLTSASVLTATGVVDDWAERLVSDTQVFAPGRTVMPPDSMTINSPARGLVNALYRCHWPRVQGSYIHNAP